LHENFRNRIFLKEGICHDVGNFSFKISFCKPSVYLLLCLTLPTIAHASDRSGVGGDFTTAGGVSANGVARWRADGEVTNAAPVYVMQFGTSGSGNGQFSYPYAIAFDHSGNMLVTDNGNDRIQKFSVEDVPFSSYSPACFTMDDALSITVSCVQYEGVQYEFTLNYTPVSNDPDGIYRKVDINTLKEKN